MRRPREVMCTWDNDASVWVATSDDVPGLAVEAGSIDALLARLKVVIPELLELNGVETEEVVSFTLLTQDVACRGTRTG